MGDVSGLDALTDGGWNRLTFVPFREGIEICELISGEPTVAVLRYAPGGRVPLHRHKGMETVLVLEGSQSDERGRYSAGAFILNQEGSVHSVWSDEGCVVLIHWHRPVEFMDPVAANGEASDVDR